MLKMFCASVSCSWKSQTLEVRERAWGKEDFLLVEEDLIRECLARINAHTFIGPSGMHLHVLRELV